MLPLSVQSCTDFPHSDQCTQYGTRRMAQILLSAHSFVGAPRSRGTVRNCTVYCVVCTVHLLLYVRGLTCSIRLVRAYLLFQIHLQCKI